MSKKIIFGGIVALSLVILPSVVSATTDSVEELQAMVTSLLRQVQELQARLKQAQGNQIVVETCYDFNIDLKIGDKGEGVNKLLTYLDKNGVASDRTNVWSGSFDEQIASYVSAFQQKYASEILKPAGLKYGTGYLGARTRAVLNKFYGCNLGNSIEHSLDKAENKSPSAPIISGQTSVVAGTSNLYKAVSKDPEGGDVTYTFNWGDGTSQNSKTFGSGYGYSVYHVWATNGIYTITVTATDAMGAKSSNVEHVKVSEAVDTTSIYLRAQVLSGSTNITGESKVTYTLDASSLTKSSSDWTLQILCSADMLTNSKGGFDCGETNTVSGNSVEISFMNATGKYQTVSATAKLLSGIDGKIMKTATAKVELPPAY